MALGEGGSLAAGAVIEGELVHARCPCVRRVCLCVSPCLRVCACLCARSMRVRYTNVAAEAATECQCNGSLVRTMGLVQFQCSSFDTVACRSLWAVPFVRPSPAPIVDTASASAPSTAVQGVSSSTSMRSAHTNSDAASAHRNADADADEDTQAKDGGGDRRGAYCIVDSGAVWEAVGRVGFTQHPGLRLSFNMYPPGTSADTVRAGLLLSLVSSCHSPLLCRACHSPLLCRPPSFCAEGSCICPDTSPQQSHRCRRPYISLPPPSDHSPSPLSSLDAELTGDAAASDKRGKRFAKAMRADGDAKRVSLENKIVVVRLPLHPPEVDGVLIGEILHQVMCGS